jgi:hypothetical protein
LNGGAPGSSNFRCGGAADRLEHAKAATNNANCGFSMKSLVVSMIGEREEEACVASSCRKKTRCQLSRRRFGGTQTHENE